MKKLTLFGLALLILSSTTPLFGQTVPNKTALLDFAAKESIEFQQKKAEALIFAKQNNIPVIIENATMYMELMYIDNNGIPQYYITDNVNAAASISTNKVNTGGGFGYSLDGNGMTVHEWDAGGVLTSHQEFGGRVTQIDNPSATHWHSTHVAGTIMAFGVDGNAKGMAPAANLNAYDWNFDTSELATAGANGALVSNHSYSYSRGWEDGIWYGDPAISGQEDYRFGFYDGYARAWDQIAYNAPYFLICKSAGNDRNDSGPGPYPPDGPYDCIDQRGIAKNLLTVAAVNDIAAGYSQPSDVVMTSFSSWGPADDGRIKPDISANGVSLYSTFDGNNSDYYSLSGTSMSTPSVAGSLILLQEHYQNLKGSNNFMLSATLKALIIHTADEAGSADGPDYEFGWGLMNTYTSAALISDDDNFNTLEVRLLNDGSTYQRTVTAVGGQPLRATIVWTDVPGTPPPASLDPSDPMVVNELDLRITESTNTYYPWKLDKDNPSIAATRNSENNVDNVEMVTIDNPTGGIQYTINVDHDGTLTGGSQAFSLIVSGITATPLQPTIAAFTSTETNIVEFHTVTFYDESTNNPTSWSWSFPGGAPSTSTLQNPTVTYDIPGQYNVSLTVDNSTNSPNTIVKTNYVNVSPYFTPYCESRSSNFSKEYIQEVVFGEINNSSGGSEYSDFTNLTMNATGWEGYTITLTPRIKGSPSIKESFRVWIDYNIDGVFNDSNELVFSRDNIRQTVSGNILIPMNVSPGMSRMRVSMQRSNGPGSCDIFTYGEVEDYSVNLTPFSWQPPVADFTADKTTVQIGESVYFSYIPNNFPQTFFWEFEGGTPPTYTWHSKTVTYDTPGVYDVSLTVGNPAGSDTETKLNFITVLDVLPPPVYCASQSNSNAQEWIAQIDIDGFSNPSGASLYSDFTSQIVDLSPGSSANVVLTPGYSGSSEREFWRIWIDFNNDGDFDDSGEKVFSANNKKNAVSGTISIPSSATGQTRMRISMKNGGSPGPCETFSNGEVEDYMVDFMAINTESISQTYNKDLVIFPNPNNGRFNVVIEKDLHPEARLKVYDMNGMLLYDIPVNQPYFELDLSELSVGIYPISVINGNEYYHSKLVKK